MFELHPQLRQDTVVIGRFPLCLLLLMNDTRYPWFILVPQHGNVREFYELGEEDQRQFMRESSYLAQTLARIFKADKMNIAALGNVVLQLHVHHIVRYRNDSAWPAPVWGKFPASPYTAEQIRTLMHKLRPALTADFVFND